MSLAVKIRYGNAILFLLIIMKISKIQDPDLEPKRQDRIRVSGSDKNGTGSATLIKRILIFITRRIKFVEFGKVVG